MQRQKSPPCPHCGGVEIYRHGRNKQRRIRYRCTYCRKTFCNRTGTVRIRSHISDKQWMDSIRLFSLRGGISGADLARFLERERKTGQRVLRILREQTTRLPVPKLEGIVEADETTMTKKWIWGAVSRKTGQVLLKRVHRRDENTLTRLVFTHTDKEAHLFTDEWGGYHHLWHHRFHLTVNHSKEFVSPLCSRIHTNTQEGVWGLIKPLAISVYRGIPKKKLNIYLREFMFRYNLKDYDQRVRVLKSYTSEKFHTLWV